MPGSHNEGQTVLKKSEDSKSNLWRTTRECKQSHLPRKVPRRDDTKMWYLKYVF